MLHRTTRAERAIFLLIAVTTLLLALLTPPFQVPDEPQHFSKAVHLAQGHLFAERINGKVGGMEPRGFADLSEQYFPVGWIGQRSEYSLSDVKVAAATRPSDGDPVFMPFPNIASYAPTLYLPQAVAIALGRLVAMPPLAIFYLARLVNALAALALLALAVRAIPFGRTVLLSVAALPTVAYHAGSVSPDATINGLGFATIALSIRAGYAQRQHVHAKSLAVVAVLLALCKGIYAPIALAGARRGRLPLILGATVVGVVAFLLWTRAAGGDQPVYDIISRKTGKLVSTAPLSAQLKVVTAAPFTFLRVLATSIVERSPVYGLQIVGRLGWNAILLPLVAYPLALAMLAAGVVAGGGRVLPLWSRGWWIAIAVGVGLLIEVAMYLTGTPLGAWYVQGTQGRYFLPVLPLIGLALMPRRCKRDTRETAGRALFGAALLLHVIAIGTVADSFWIHGFTTPNGMPTHRSVLNAMFLPSPRW